MFFLATRNIVTYCHKRIQYSDFLDNKKKGEFKLGVFLAPQ